MYTHYKYVLFLNRGFSSIKDITDINLYKKYEDQFLLMELNASNISWNTNFCKVFDFYISNTFVLSWNNKTSIDSISNSLHNYNNKWYTLVSLNENQLNLIWDFIFSNFSVFSKHYGNYKIIISYIYMQSILISLSGTNFLHKTESDIDNCEPLLGWFQNYDIISNSLDLFKKYNIILEMCSVTISKADFKKNILHLLEILQIKGFVEKKIKLQNNKSTVFFYLKNFKITNYSNSNVSFIAPLCFKFKDQYYKIENSIYSITDAIHMDNTLKYKPTINLNPSIIEDQIEYLVDSEVLNIAKKFIIDELKTLNKEYGDVLSCKLINLELTNLKNIHKKIQILYSTNRNLENVVTGKLYSDLGNSSVSLSEEIYWYNVLSLLNFIESVLLDKCFFFIFFLDFRGRMYSVSSYSPISSKLMRSIIKYKNCKTHNDFAKNNECSVVFNIVKERFIHIIEKNFNFKIDSDFFKNIVFWLLISIGSFFKSKLLDKNAVSINDLLEYAIKVFYSDVSILLELDLYEKIECSKYITMLRDALDGNYNGQRFICKDSTASVFQHLFQFLRPKNLKTLEYCNIYKNNFWYDPYSIIISFFLEKNTISEFSKKYFSRKYLKKSIMTQPYSVTYFSSWKYFKSAIDYSLIHNKSSFYKLSQYERDCLLSDFEKFYKFLEQDFEIQIFYLKQSKDIEHNFVDICFDDDTSIYFSYLQINNKRKEIKNKKYDIRVTYNEFENTKNVDNIKTKRALRANLIHACDSFFARKIISRYNCLVIHDCFCISATDINLCLDDMNMYYIITIYKDDVNLQKELLHANTYSLTVVV